jgi:hypothetical protein
MANITVRVEGHYEVEESPVGRAYEWHPAQVTLKCDCGEELTFSGASTSPICSRCGTDYSAIIGDIQEREGRLRREDTHPWRYDNQEQAEQYQREEVAYPEGSPWRYNHVTSRGTADERRVQ